MKMGGVTTLILYHLSMLSALLQAHSELLYFTTTSITNERSNSEGELCSQFPQQSRVAECSAQSGVKAKHIQSTIQMKR